MEDFRFCAISLNRCLMTIDYDVVKPRWAIVITQDYPKLPTSSWIWRPSIIIERLKILFWRFWPIMTYYEDLWPIMTYFAPRYDRLRLVRTPVGLVGAIKEAVIKHWWVRIVILIIIWWQSSPLSSLIHFRVCLQCTISSESLSYAQSVDESLLGTNGPIIAVWEYTGCLSRSLADWCQWEGHWPRNKV